MRIIIQVNSKEMAALYNNSEGKEPEDIKIEFQADVTTEAKSLTAAEEHLIYGGVLWALLMMLPHKLVKEYFLAWNDVVETAHKTLETKIRDQMVAASSTEEK